MSNRAILLSLSLCLLAAAPMAGCAPTIIELKTFSSAELAIADLQAGRSDAVVGDYVAMAYGARESGSGLQVVGAQFDRQDIGIGVAKHSAALKDAVTDALASLMADKTYIGILLTWNVSATKVDPPVRPQRVLPKEEIPELKDGVLKVGMEMGYPPMEFFDEIKEASGVDVELANAIGAALKVEVTLVDMPFDALIDALHTGKVDVVISTMAITPERAAVVDFVPYLSMGSGIMVAAGNPLNIGAIEHLCGRRVAIQEAMAQIDTIEKVECK